MGGDRENGHEAEKVNGSRGGEQLKVDSTRTPNQGKDGRVLKVDATRLSESGAALDSSHLVGYSPLRLAFAPDVDVKEVCNKKECHGFSVSLCSEALLCMHEMAQMKKHKVPDLKHMRRHSVRKKDQCAALVVGHYCHDQITLHGGETVYSLGGSVSYITNVFEALGIGSRVASKVGPDFLYCSQITHPPEVIEDQKTTEFFADFTQGEERVLKAGSICAPIESMDIPDMDYELGLAVGIACEVLPETLQHMVDVARYVVVDVQALIRTIDPKTGLVGLRNLDETPFNDMLKDIHFLKAARNEALYIDIEKVRQKTCLIVTEGKNGSRIYSKDREIRVPAFPAIEVDPTGAGDSFLAGFSAGLYRGLPIDQAVLMGNFFGGLAVAQVGIPHFTAGQLESMDETRSGVQIEQFP